jgi:hypothetical protein
MEESHPDILVRNFWWLHVLFAPVLHQKKQGEDNRQWMKSSHEPTP